MLLVAILSSVASPRPKRDTEAEMVAMAFSLNRRL